MRLTIVALLCSAVLTLNGAPLRKSAAVHAPYYATPALRVGSITLTLCNGNTAYCGSIQTALDPADEVPGLITTSFEFYPHRNAGAVAGMIVAEEGGPGYSTTGTRSYYLGLYLPLMDQRDLLLVDKRGTGKSQYINCPSLQVQGGLTLANIAACGAQLGPSSDLYGSGLAADDLTAVLDALAVDKIDLYGDSYGSYFSQAFAGRYPARLRSLVLDGAYPVAGLNPWYPELTFAMQNAFNVTCARNANCAASAGTSLDRLAALLNYLRATPFTGSAYDGNGQLRTVSADPSSLAFLFWSNGLNQVLSHDMDAAARALLEQGDGAPLLRLLAENATASSLASPPAQLSNGLFVAVSCQDYPQVYNMTSAPAVRVGQDAAATAAQDPNIYSPFTIKEFRGAELDISLLDLCLTWPVGSAAHPPGQPVPPGTVFPAVPTLVVSGELDSLTPAAQGAQAAALFPHSEQIVVANSFHVDALGDLDDCASAIVRRFVTTLDVGDTSCAAGIPEVRTVGRFATSYGQVDAAGATAGNQGRPADLRAAAAAVSTAGDAIMRWWVNTSGADVGLRGGKFTYTINGSTVQFTLTNLRWVNDLAVNGTVTWTPFAGSGAVQAKLAFNTAGGQAALTVTWADRTPQSKAVITGAIGGRQIAAIMAAP